MENFPDKEIDQKSIMINNKPDLTSLDEKISIAIKDEFLKIKEELISLNAIKENAREESLNQRSAKEIATLSIYLLERETELNKLKSKEADYLSEIHQLKVERDNLHNAVNSLLSSTSWKLTAPLRKVVRLLQRRQ